MNSSLDELLKSIQTALNNRHLTKLLDQNQHEKCSTMIFRKLSVNYPGRRFRPLDPAGKMLGIHRIQQENTENRWNMEAVFRPQIVRIFSDVFLPESGRTSWSWRERKIRYALFNKIIKNNNRQINVFPLFFCFLLIVKKKNVKKNNKRWYNLQALGKKFYIRIET